LLHLVGYYNIAVFLLRSGSAPKKLTNRVKGREISRQNFPGKLRHTVWKIFKKKTIFSLNNTNSLRDHDVLCTACIKARQFPELFTKSSRFAP
jgi:hypothetical protein